MLRILLPVILVILGIVGGVAAGIMLKPAPAAKAADGEYAEEHGGDKYKDDHGGEDDHGDGKGGASSDTSYVPMSRKLIVPVTARSGRKSLVAIELHLEVDNHLADDAELHEPKLRDAFLRTLVWFATTGAFSDEAHPNETFDELAHELKVAAESVLGEGVHAVLIGDLIKQDI